MEFLIIIVSLLIKCESARILGVFPIPLQSHQSVFKVLTDELVTRGHHVTVITGLPSKEPVLENYTEIDRSEVALGIKRKVINSKISIPKNTFVQCLSVIDIIFSLVDEVLDCSEVRNWTKNKSQQFDLILVEESARSGVILSHVFKAPAISISSYGGTIGTFETIGGAIHNFLYPLSNRQKYRNLSLWENIFELYFHYRLNIYYNYMEALQDDINRKRYGPNTPTLHELNNHIKMLFLNTHLIWDSNRPVPSNVIYFGGLHQKPQKALPKELKSLLDSSSNGVIYMSLGTTVDENIVPKEKIQILINVFTKLPYNIFWKWNGYDITVLPANIKIFSWFPQSDVLRHPKIKLFITQGGLQSTDEAITAGVPLIGIPLIFDQYYNVDKYVQLGIGKSIDITTLDEKKLNNAISEVINNETYKNNIIKLRDIINAGPQSSLDRAVFWIEYVLKYSAGHPRTLSANMPWYIYYEIDLVLFVLFFLLLVSIIFVLLVLKLFKIVSLRVKNTKED